ncbi:MAG: TrmH family RNA methyltransferase [Lachnospiraceae bacterium]|nr:TrmH family RNA methyltransferase [Lachnospiraceae bacterium]
MERKVNGMEIKRYKHDAAYSYTLGMALTIELISQKDIYPIRKIYVHPDYVPKDNKYNMFQICKEAQLPMEVNQKAFQRLSTKENVYVIGIFDKRDRNIEPGKQHVVLVNPSDSGNLGTILRTGLGFGFRDYVIIKPSVDIYDPKTIRSSMGAFFHVRFTCYDSFEQYRQRFSDRQIYLFMLDGKINLKDLKERPRKTPFSLVFGNEGSGLPEIFHHYGDSIYIEHNHEIDSLNLSVAFGIAANAFSESL